MNPITPSTQIIAEIQSIGLCATRKWLKTTEKQNDDAALRELKAHAGYVYPNLFVDDYIKDISYRMLELKDFHIQILNAIKPGEYGNQINVQAPAAPARQLSSTALSPYGESATRLSTSLWGCNPKNSSSSSVATNAWRANA